MTRKLVLGFVAAVTAVILGFTRAKNPPPSDLRDAVAEDAKAPELNTDVAAAADESADLPVPPPSSAEEKPKAAPEEKPQAPAPVKSSIDNFGVVLYQDSDMRGGDREVIVYRGGDPAASGIAALRAIGLKGAPDEAGFAFLRSLGVNSLVNLQSSHPSDQALCDKYGIQCRQFGIYPFDMFKLAKNPSFQDAFRFVLEERKAGRKVYIHCMKGKDRTGALAAALIIREKACGADFDKAKLREIIEESLKKHNFWYRNYPKWHAEIIGWVDNFEGNKSWLCK